MIQAIGANISKRNCSEAVDGYVSMKQQVIVIEGLSYWRCSATDHARLCDHFQPLYKTHADSVGAKETDMCLSGPLQKGLASHPSWRLYSGASNKTLYVMLYCLIAIFKVLILRNKISRFFTKIEQGYLNT